MFIVNVEWKYWLLCVAAGLAVGLLGVFIELIADDIWLWDALRVVVLTQFGAVFFYCLRSTIGANWWRGLSLILGIVAAQYGALKLAFAYYIALPIGPQFTYGAAFALFVTAIVALLFLPARNMWLLAGTILASGVVGLSYWPLEEILPYRGFLISETAMWATFGLVDAVVAALLGLRLFVNKSGADG